MNWKNWSGSVECTPVQILFPTTEEEVVSAVKNAAQSNRKVRVAGSGHSFTAVVATNDLLISLDKMQGLVDVNTKKKTATFWAGTKLSSVGEILHENGLAQENLGDINAQSLAGSISTGTHGSGIKFGTLSTQVVALRLVDGLGNIHELKEGDASFKAAQLSLGALGIITQITLRCQDQYLLRYTSAKTSFTECLDRLEELIRTHRNFEFYLFPYSQSVQLKIMDETLDEVNKRTVINWFNDYVLENFTFEVMSRLVRLFPGISASVSRLAASAIGTGAEVQPSHRVYATPRLVKFQEMEYNIPIEHFKEAIMEVKEMIEREKIQVHFPIECRFVKEDDIYLSPAFERRSAYIAVHMYKGMAFESYFRKVEKIMDRHGGRPHWGKMHFKTSEELKKLYPKWEDFQAVRLEFDPKGVFMSGYMEGVLGRQL